MTGAERAELVETLRGQHARTNSMGHLTRGSAEFLVEELLPVVERIATERAAQELDRAIRENRTTVAKLSPVERLTCILVKAEDLVVRAAALRGGVS